jgi:hypothetical protein
MLAFTQAAGAVGNINHPVMVTFLLFFLCALTDYFFFFNGNCEDIMKNRGCQAGKSKREVYTEKNRQMEFN